MRFFAGLYDHTEPMAQPFASEEDEQDGHQHQMTLELPKVQKNGTENWLDFVTILDRILFVVLTVVYAFVDMYFLI